ncbi:hypothetical protein L9F63_024158, partial [Diploptera punctata]
MITKCPSDTPTFLSEKCEATNDFKEHHYIMHLPRLNSSGVWYQNMYCALCHGDARNLLELNNSVACSRNLTESQ